MGIKAKLMLVMGYLGAVIGAGFASGQEIMQFFVAFGKNGFYGAVLSAVLFSLCGGLLLFIAHRKSSSNYQEILAYLLGPGTGKVVDFLLAIFLFLGISLMLSASGAVFNEHLFLPKALGVFLAYVLVIVFLITGKKGLILSYNLLVPVKLILLLLITGYAAFFASGVGLAAYDSSIVPTRREYWAIASILYVAYNFALAMVVLVEYQSVVDRKTGIIGAVWGGAVLGLLVIITYLALGKYLPVVLRYEVPMLYVTGNISLTIKYLYTTVLWVGIFTTALANAYGFAKRFAVFTKLSYGPCLILCMTLSLPISMQNFSDLVSNVYPVFGILGLVILGSLIIRVAQEFGISLTIISSLP